jgi:hypothetical protein
MLCYLSRIKQHSIKHLRSSSVRKNRKLLVSLPLLGPALLFIYRCSVAARSIFSSIPSAWHWLKESREVTNFTYDLEPPNLRYLSALIAEITQQHYSAIESLGAEAINDERLRSHVQEIHQHPLLRQFADERLRWGRQLAYYVLVRAIKPKVVVETGVDKGLGAVTIAAALQRNQQQGFAGYYYGTDIDPNAGYLLSGEYAGFGEILLGDSASILASFEKTIDLFIFDSERTPEYEALEYQSVKDKLSDGAVLLSTFAHGSMALLDFALESGRQYLSFRERPMNHFYSGSEIGVAFANRTARA